MTLDEECVFYNFWNYRICSILKNLLKGCSVYPQTAPEILERYISFLILHVHVHV